jgi:hypothetical protein
MLVQMVKRPGILLAALAVAAATAACTGGVAAPPAATDAPATAQAAALPSPTPTPTPTPTAAVDGYVTGSWEFFGTSDSATPSAGHAFVNLIAFDTNDPRVNGNATFDAGDVWPGASWMPATGYTWAILTITNAGGTWSGPCKGASWGSASTVLVSCELNGTGDYRGKGFFVQMRGGEDIPLTLEGVIYAGDIPEE